MAEGFRDFGLHGITFGSSRVRRGDEGPEYFSTLLSTAYP